MFVSVGSNVSVSYFVFVGGNCSAPSSNTQGEPCLQLTGARWRIRPSCGLQFPHVRDIGKFPLCGLVFFLEENGA